MEVIKIARRLETALGKTLGIKNSSLPDVVDARYRAEWRIYAFFWFVPGLMMAGLFLAPGPASPAAHFWGAAIPLGSAALATGLSLLWMARWRILADRDGLTIRGLWSERRMRWDEIRSYYTVSNNNSVWYYVQTDTGKFRLGNGSNQDYAVRQAVVERATAAVTSDWKPEGSFLAENETKIFRPNLGAGNEIFVAFGLAWTVALLVAWFLPNKWTAGWTGPRPWWLWLVNPLVVQVILYTGLFSPRIIRAYRARLQVRRRFQEEIQVSRERIRWSDGQKSVDVRWSEITAVTTGSGGYNSKTLMRTRDGELSFVPSTFKDPAILENILANYLPDGAERLKDSSQPQATRLPDGGIRFGYRNGISRFLLACLLFFWLLVPVSSARLYYFPRPGTAPDPSDLQTVWLFLAGGLPFVAYAFACYYRSCIILRDDVLEHRGLFKTTKLRLDDVRSLKMMQYYFVVRTEDKKLILGLSLDDVAGLKREIQRRAPGLVLE